MADRVAEQAAAPETAPAALYVRWLHRAVAVIAESVDALNAMNVFPVSDADTGSNVEQTLAGIARAVPQPGPVEADSVVRAAVLSAHGNSGAILAEMIASVSRLLADQDRAGDQAGRAIARMLRTAARAATAAVARPVAGTILSVADAAATAADRAADEHPGDPLCVSEAAATAAAAALSRTPDQLDVLAEAGVVDAGGQAYVVLLDVLVEVLGGEPARPLPSPGAGPAAAMPSADEVEYEVMYAIRGAGPDRLSALREELSVLGHSVVVVGEQSLAQVHVHLRDAGAAVEAGLGHGGLSQIRISALPTAAAPEPTTAERTVVAVVAGPGLSEAVTAHGGSAVLPTGREALLAELTSAVDAAPGDVVVLPNDMETLELAGHLAARMAAEPRSRRRIAVIPTVSQVQGLAALAVHEPAASFEQAVIAMSSTAGHTRHGAVTVAEAAAMTMAGRCRAGDVLGLVDGDFVEIGDQVEEVAWRVVRRLLSGGGELLTAVLGADADPHLLEALTQRLSRTPETERVEVEVVHGGQRRYALLLGVA